jgi:hypothetical protein
VEGLDDRLDACSLFVGTDRLGARPRRFSANVDEISAVAFHPECHLHGIAGRQHACLGKRVRRDVEDAHDERAETQIEGTA